MPSVEDAMSAQKFLFWAFVVSLVLMQTAYMYLIYRQHQVFLKAVDTESNCGTSLALERETVRYQLRQYYLSPTTEQLDLEFTRYNNWRLWVIWIPAMIAIAVFMIIKFGVNVIPPVFYLLLSILALYLGFMQMYELPNLYGYPAFWSWKAFQFGKIHQLVEFHTQAYSQIHALLDARLVGCLDENAEYTCMELLPTALKENLVRRYVSAHPESNVYQAANFFEESLKNKNYDAIIGYMRLSGKSQDLQDLAYGTGGSALETLGADDEWLNDLESRFSTDLIKDVQGIYLRSFWSILVVGWALILYFTWFHRRYWTRRFEPSIAGSVNNVIWVIALAWFGHYFIL
jgi:hypothetical protein